AGVTLIDTGIGWHEARVPTIAGMVPRAAFSWVTARIKASTRLAVIATNRINDPQVAEQLLSSGTADLISMARPLLADAEFARKAAEGRESEINTCIACNQACLDKIFVGKRATCLVNPRAARETELVFRPARTVRRVGVVGAGVRRDGRRAWASRHAVRARSGDRRPVLLRSGSAGEGRIPRDFAVLQA